MGNHSGYHTMVVREHRVLKFVVLVINYTQRKVFSWGAGEMLEVLVIVCRHMNIWCC